MKTKLIDTLILAGVIPPNSVTELNTVSKTPLLETLLSKGHGSEDDVLKIIKNKLLYDVVDAATLSKISSSAIQSIPINFIIDYHVLPFYVDESVLNIAMADPTYEECFNELNFLVEKNIVVFGAKLSDINLNINKHFNLKLFTNFKHIKTTNVNTPIIPKPSSVPSFTVADRLNEKTTLKQVLVANPFDNTKINIKLPPTDTLYDKTPMPKKPNFIPHDNLPRIPKDPEELILENINKEIKNSNKQNEENKNNFDLKKEFLREYKNDHKDYVEYFENQKKLLEIQFEAKISELKEKISRLEEDHNLNKLRRELEDKIQNTRTLEKLSEIENMKQYNDILLKIQSQVNSQNTNSSSDILKNELMNLHNSILKIGEEQRNINERIKNQDEILKHEPSKKLAISTNKKDDIKISNDFFDKNITDEENIKEDIFCAPKETVCKRIDSKSTDVELEKFEKNHTVIEEILLESDYTKNTLVAKEDVSKEDSTVIRNIKEEIEYNTSSKIIKAPELNIDNMFVENININFKGISEAKTREDLFEKSFIELKKISNKGILLFVRFENIVGVAGFGDKINENVLNYKDTILIPSMFKKVYDQKTSFSGLPSDDNISKNFYLHFGSSKPQYVVIAPILLKKRVFAMLYSEDAKDPELINKIAKAMTSSFEMIFNK